MSNVQLLTLLIISSVTYIIFAQSSEENQDLCKEKCRQTEYTAYTKCLCLCSQCDCDHCMTMTNSCNYICRNCCYQKLLLCKTMGCCQKTCHATCKSSSCTTECKQTCTENMLELLKQEQNQNYKQSTPSNEEEEAQNITILNIHHVINHTSVITLPDPNNNIINCTEPTETVEKIQKEPCCQVISPRQCVPLPHYPFIKCFHYRQHICGSHCKAPIVHKQNKQNCEETSNGVDCRKIIMFIPQPTPRCFYQQFWPYVTCGIQQEFCGGCYSHYNLPFQSPSCPFSCYDDGYNAGPLYRQGPFYRPGFAHVPSCFQTGTCNLDYNVENGLEAQPFANKPIFRGCGYPPITYDDDLHIEPDSEDSELDNLRKRDNSSGKKQPENNSTSKQVYQVPIFPHYTIYGYPFRPQISTYNLPREVTIQAVLTQPQKSQRYAQITINQKGGEKMQNESEIATETSKTD